MSEYYHPSTDKIIKIEPGISGGVTTVTETSGSMTQTLTLRESEVDHFVQALISGGWLTRQLL